MKLLIFTEGTILMSKSGLDHAREEIVEQSKNKKASVKKYADYVPIGNAAMKILEWTRQGAEIVYMTSRRNKKEVAEIQNVLNINNFPEGRLEFRVGNEEYKDVAERIKPDVLIEDDCESIGGEIEMTYPHIQPKIRDKIKSMVIKEFAGIDNLPNNVNSL